ncbi:MAG: hypothetical protein VW806_11335, partial [Halieaceae bacterium]
MSFPRLMRIGLRIDSINHQHFLMQRGEHVSVIANRSEWDVPGHFNIVIAGPIRYRDLPRDIDLGIAVEREIPTTSRM